MRAIAMDGTEAVAEDEGSGTPILVVHGGMGDRTVWKPVTDLLRDRFRTVRLERRRYRMDLPGPVTMAQEVEHVAAIAAKLRHPEPDRPALERPAAEHPAAERPDAEEPAPEQPDLDRPERPDLDRPERPTLERPTLERPTLERPTLERPVLVGHSSGAVVALEAMVADPGAYAGAVLYEPPVVIGEPLSADKLAGARAALARDKPGTALSIFLRDVVGMPAPLAWAAGAVVGRHPDYRRRVVRQLDDNDALDEIGVRLAAYARLDLPILLLGGDKSPRHLAERLDALERALPRARRLLMHGQGHNAERSAPRRVATAIATFIDDTAAAG